MKLDRFIRVAISVVVILAFVIATGALLFITESALNVWDRLRAGPAPILYAYVAVMALFAMAAVWLIWRLVVKKKVAHVVPAKTLSRGDIKARLTEAEAAGVDVGAVVEEEADAFGVAFPGGGVDGEVVVVALVFPGIGIGGEEDFEAGEISGLGGLVDGGGFFLREGKGELACEEEGGEGEHQGG